jgi:hypothetical protein
MNTVPITLGDMYAGFASADGLIRDEGEHLIVEFRVMDKVFNTFNSSVKQVRIPVADVASVKFTAGWFGGGKLVIQTDRLRGLDGLPKIENGRVTFTVAKADVPAARRFVDKLHTAG